MTKIMRDSVNASGIPVLRTEIACYYGNGPYANHTAVAKRLPGIPLVGIDVNGSMPSMQVRDWETGDKGGNLEQWVINHNKAAGKKDAVIYCNRSTIGEVRTLTASQILGKDYYLWIATGDGTVYGPDSYVGVIACQTHWYAEYDESIVWPVPAISWTGPSARPPTPAPHITVGKWALPKAPQNGKVPAVVTWYGDAGETTRQANIPEELWNQITWSK